MVEVEGEAQREASTTAVVTLLSENTARDRGLLGEHGLSWHLRVAEREILFDTGQGLALAHNAEVLRVDLAKVTDIVLSHGHYDHLGGVQRVLARAPGARLWAHPAALEPKYARRKVGSGYAAVGLDASDAERESLRQRLRPTAGPVAIAPGLWVTGSIPRCVEPGPSKSRFFLDAEGQRPDPLLDDQALFFRTERGLVLLLGCGHAGVICTLRHLQALCPGEAIDSVLGGMHLLDASSERRKQTLRALRHVGLRRVAPLHCTGDLFTRELMEEYGEGCERPAVGARWVFEGDPSFAVAAGASGAW